MENEGNESSAKYLLHVEGTMPVFISCQFDFNTSIVKKAFTGKKWEAELHYPRAFWQGSSAILSFSLKA